MPDVRPQPDNFDFEGEMQSLANQAQAKSPSNGHGRADRGETLLAIGQLIRPLAAELETLKRTNAEQTTMLAALAKILRDPPANSTLETISQQMQRLNSVESANSKLFDALHAELKGYKDNFLFDTLQKPFVRDLVSLFDDLSSMHEQIVKQLAALPDHPAASEEKAFLETLAGNADNQLHHMIEVFLRMDVTISKTAAGAPVDKKLHRIVSFEPAPGQDDDNLVARSVKPGFFWRERTIRPEEIIVRRAKAETPAGKADPAPAPAEAILPS